MAKDSYYDIYEMKFVDEIEDDSNPERYIKMPRYDGVVSFKIKPTYEELEKALDKACLELVKMSLCKDCYEYVEKGCPFIRFGEICSGECHDFSEWKKELLK